MAPELGAFDARNYDYSSSTVTMTNVHTNDNLRHFWKKIPRIQPPKNGITKHPAGIRLELAMIFDGSRYTAFLPVTTVEEDETPEKATCLAIYLTTGPDGHFYRANGGDDLWTTTRSKLECFMGRDEISVEIRDVYIPARFVAEPNMTMVPNFGLRGIVSVEQDGLFTQNVVFVFDPKSWGPLNYEDARIDPETDLDSIPVSACLQYKLQKTVYLGFIAESWSPVRQEGLRMIIFGWGLPTSTTARSSDSPRLDIRFITEEALFETDTPEIKKSKLDRLLNSH